MYKPLNNIEIQKTLNQDEFASKFFKAVLPRDY